MIIFTTLWSAYISKLDINCFLGDANKDLKCRHSYSFEDLLMNEIFESKYFV
jgi:hypothetical protein